jgi:hypothetical protein
MGLFEKLTTDGSRLSKYDGADPYVNPLSTTKTFSIHSTGNPLDSYSLNGSNSTLVNNAASLYEDGVQYTNPLPSELDLGGELPIGPLSALGVIPINNSFSGGTYLNNLPEQGIIGDNNVATPFG